MGQPNPPGDIPLIEGLGSEWNDIVSALPEEQRAVLGPKLKERVSSFESLKQWEDLHKSGINPEHASTAINLMSVIENNPREVYDKIGSYLGLTKAETKEIVDDIKKAEATGDVAQLEKLQTQIDTMSQIMLAQRNQETQDQRIAQEEAALESELSTLKSKYGDNVNEEEVVMRMIHKGMTAEQAYQEYAGMVSEIQKRRPAPFVLGSGGTAPNRTIDVKKLDNKETKSLVAQMMDHANAARNNP